MTGTYNAWIGRSRHSHDRISTTPARLVQSILPGQAINFEKGTLPPLWHWAYFPDIVSLDQTDEDGHPKRGDFLPPVDLPRRMWAGGALTFYSAIQFGDTVERRSTIANVVMKEGRTGPLCFVTVEHRYFVRGWICIEERQDIVYRGGSGNPVPAPQVSSEKPERSWIEEVRPSPVMLFRYSAATSNSHRIHYDRDYASGEEGYPGLVVHGPLLATLLADLAVRRSSQPLATFSFRAKQPVFDLPSFHIGGSREADAVNLSVFGPDGSECMQAEATLKTHVNTR